MSKWIKTKDRLPESKEGDFDYYWVSGGEGVDYLRWWFEDKYWEGLEDHDRYEPSVYAYWMEVEIPDLPSGTDES